MFRHIFASQKTCFDIRMQSPVSRAKTVSLLRQVPTGFKAVFFTEKVYDEKKENTFRKTHV